MIQYIGNPHMEAEAILWTAKGLEDCKNKSDDLPAWLVGAIYRSEFKLHGDTIELIDLYGERQFVTANNYIVNIRNIGIMVMPPRVFDVIFAEKPENVKIDYIEEADDYAEM